MMLFPKDVSRLPGKPGVYLFYDILGNILYVGKAKHLKSRIRSYLNEELVEQRKRPLLKEIHHLEYLTTETEYDALQLESDLIKSHRPPYNVRLMDDKGYCYIRFTRETFPSICRVYRRDDRGDFMGPYLDSKGALMAVRLIREIWGLRDCKTFKKGGCVNWHIGLCMGPCLGKVDSNSYKEKASCAKRFLHGEWKEAKRELETRMKQASKSENFEEAARLRDLLNGVDLFFSRRSFMGSQNDDEDVVAFGKDENNTVASILIVREGRVVHSGRVILKGSVTPQSVSEFLLQYYSDVPVPAKILLDMKMEDMENVSQILSKRRGKNVELAFPSRGQGKRLLDLARRNARLFLAMETRGDGVEDLAQSLHLTKTPDRIECYDISHLGQEYVCASMAVFEKGKAEKSSYRWFKIKTHLKGDDARMEEVLSRRTKRLGCDGWGVPDLVVVDGGVAQLGAAQRAFAGKNIPIIALSKRDECVHLAGCREPVSLERDSPGLLLLMALRDEAHRFANSFRRRLQADRMSKTALDSVPGVGPTLRNRLLRRFGSVANIASSSEEDIASVKGVGKLLARHIKEALEPQLSGGGR